MRLIDINSIIIEHIKQYVMRYLVVVSIGDYASLYFLNTARVKEMFILQ